jgi:hypothetical protein
MVRTLWLQMLKVTGADRTMEKALSPLDEKFDCNALKESPALDDPKEMIKDQKEKAEYRTGDQKKNKTNSCKKKGCTFLSQPLWY